MTQWWMPGLIVYYTTQGLSYRGSYALIGVKGGAALDEKALLLLCFGSGNRAISAILLSNLTYNRRN